MLVGHKITKSLCTEDDLRLQDEMTSIILARRRESRRLRLIYLAAVVALVLIIPLMMTWLLRSDQIAFEARFPEPNSSTAEKKSDGGVTVARMARSRSKDMAPSRSKEEALDLCHAKQTQSSDPWNEAHTMECMREQGWQFICEVQTSLQRERCWSEMR